MAFLDKARTLLCSDAPTSSFFLDLGVVWVILTWRSLKPSALLKEDVFAHLCANFPGGVFMLDWRLVRAVIAWTWFMLLLHLVWFVLESLTH